MAFPLLAPISGPNFPLADAWRQRELKETKDAEVQVVDGKDATEVKKRPGMISRLSKSIKKVIARLTPTKLRKRWHLEEEEEGKAGEKAAGKP